MPLDTARLATLGLTVAMPLPATWTGVAVDRPRAAARRAVDAAATRRRGGRHRGDGDRSAPRRRFADPAILPFSFPLPEGVRLVMGSEIVADPRLGLQALIGGALAPAHGTATPATDAAASPESAPKADTRRG